MDIMKTMNNHPIKEFNACLARFSVIEKEDTRLMLIDYPCIIIPKAFRTEVLKREHLSHAVTKNTILDIAAKYYWPGFQKDVPDPREEPEQQAPEARPRVCGPSHAEHRP